MPRPLEGVRVLDLSRLYPGPFATLVLADLGAMIVKVEATRGGDYTRYLPPLGTSMSAAFAALNRDKLGIALDLKRPEGADVLRRLVADADVLLESFRPGVMGRLGLDYEALSALNPRLVYCAITGYGQSGPLAHRAGHDMNYQAIAGVLGLTGTDGAVVQPGIQTADVGGGALYGVVGVLAALYDRERTGRGRFVDVSMTDGVAGLGVMHHARHHLDAEPVEPGGDLLAGAALCYRPWRCADGRYLAVGALEPKFWMALCNALGRPDLIGDGFATGARGDAVRAELDAIFATRTRDEWAELLGPHDCCVEPVLEIGEARAHPHAVARGLFGTHAHPAEKTEFLHHYPNPSLLPGAEPPNEPRPAPTLGQDTGTVLRAAGYSDDEIAALIETGAIA